MINTDAQEFCSDIELISKNLENLAAKITSFYEKTDSLTLQNLGMSIELQYLDGVCFNANELIKDLKERKCMTRVGGWPKKPPLYEGPRGRGRSKG